MSIWKGDSLVTEGNLSGQEWPNIKILNHEEGRIFVVKQHIMGEEDPKKLTQKSWGKRIS